MSSLLFQFEPPGGTWFQKTQGQVLALLLKKDEGWEAEAQRARGASWVSPAPEGGRPMRSQVSGELAVACLNASLCLGIVQNVSCGFFSSLFSC